MRSHSAIGLLFFGLTAFLAASAQADPQFRIRTPGTEDIVQYENYGRYENIGSENFKYVITNRFGLIKASGDGIDPSTTLYEDPAYIQAKELGRLDGDWWKHVRSAFPQIDFFVWASCTEEPGVRLFYTGKVLERAGHYTQALKAWRACMVLYPDSASYSGSGEFQYSTSEACWHSIENLLRLHPELNVRLVGANVSTRVDEKGLHTFVVPGRFEEIPESQKVETATLVDFELPKVSLVKHRNKDWTLLVEGKPYFIKGLNYSPTKVGEVPWEWDWEWADDDYNGVEDVLETWVDKNKNGTRDEDEPVVGDFKIMADMGANTIKTYSTNVNVLLMRRVFKEHGIRVILGNFLGAYVSHSGADWDEGTDYTNPVQRERMKQAVREMVMRHKDEPWLLAWILGNENNMPNTLEVNATRTNANSEPEAYAQFLNEVAEMIHEIDPHHPVGVGNLMTGLVEYYGEHAPAIDFLGVNSYIGPTGFGSTWKKVVEEMDRPVLITEYGCDSYWTERGPDEQGQMEYHMGCWKDIVYHAAGNPGEGNSIGGCLFEFVDEWWKDFRNKLVDGQWVPKDALDHQSTVPTTDMAFPDGKSQEEWLGIVSQGNGTQSPFLRVPKKAYYAYQEEWTDGNGRTKGDSKGQQTVWK